MDKTRLVFTSLAVVMMGMSANALEVYQIPGNVTGGIDLLNMSDTYYTDRLKGKNNCSISGAVTHSDVTEENPFLLMGNHTGATSFNPSTKLDTIPIRIVDGGYWKYVNDSGALATYTNGFGHGHLDIESGSFEALSLILSGDDSQRSTLNVTNGSRLTVSTMLTIGSGGGCGSFVLDGGAFLSYSMVAMGDKISAGFDLVNTAQVVNATMIADRGDGFFLTRTDGGYDGDKAIDRNVLILGEGGILQTKNVTRRSNARGHIYFRGGKIERTNRTGSGIAHLITGDDKSGTLELEGDGSPIHIDTATNVINLCYAWTPIVLLTGNGGFKKSGSGKLTINYANNRLRSSFSGGVFVDEGVLSVDMGRGDRIPATNLLTVAEGAAFDMNGSAVGFTGAMGAGIITNSSETAATLTLGYGDGDYAFSATVGERISIVKVGTGTLAVSGNAANNDCDLDIASGTVVFGVKNSTTYRNVTVRSGATLDISKCNFVCANLVKEPGGIIKPKPGLSIFIR